jgi:hypothetical protein
MFARHAIDTLFGAKDVNWLLNEGALCFERPGYRSAFVIGEASPAIAIPSD